MLKSLAVIVVLLASATHAHSECVYDRDAVLALDYKTFNSRSNGWKVIAKNPDFSDIVADLISSYRSIHADSLLPRDSETLSSQEGDIRAIKGDSQTAITLFQASLNETDSITRLVTVAKIAFLKRDKEALLKARTDMAGLPKPKGFDAANEAYIARGGKSMTWPPLLESVDGLVACFDKTYAEAYRCSAEPVG